MLILILCFRHSISSPSFQLRLHSHFLRCLSFQFLSLFFFFVAVVGVFQPKLAQCFGLFFHDQFCFSIFWSAGQFYLFIKLTYFYLLYVLFIPVSSYLYANFFISILDFRRRKLRLTLSSILLSLCNY
jgi:hypothetical protein